MNKREYRLWKSMVEAIDQYINNKNNFFFRTVGALEGALDASDWGDEEIIRQWYDLWIPLESFRATEGNEVDKDKVLPYLIKMKEFVLKCLGKPPQTERQYQLWKSMIEAIDNYLYDKTQDFSGTVIKLEEALDPSVFHDVDLISQWYDFWKPLEDRRTVEGNEVNKPKAIEELTGMKNFLLDHLQKPLPYEDKDED